MQENSMLLPVADDRYDVCSCTEIYVCECCRSYLKNEYFDEDEE